MTLKTSCYCDICSVLIKHNYNTNNYYSPDLSFGNKDYQFVCSSCAKSLQSTLDNLANVNNNIISNIEIMNAVHNTYDKYKNCPNSFAETSYFLQRILNIDKENADIALRYWIDHNWLS